MKNLFLITLLFLVPFFVQADNWKLFPPNQVTYFHFVGERDFTGDKFDVVSPYYVDAVEIEGDIQYQYIMTERLTKLFKEPNPGILSIILKPIYFKPTPVKPTAK